MIKWPRTLEQDIVEADVGKPPSWPAPVVWLRKALSVLGVDTTFETDLAVIRIATENNLNTGSAQDGRRVPKNPTIGWRRHELIAHDIVSIGWSDDQITRALKRLGYAIED